VVTLSKLFNKTLFLYYRERSKEDEDVQDKKDELPKNHKSL
jgi:hypothetical protein